MLILIAFAPSPTKSLVIILLVYTATLNMMLVKYIYISSKTSAGDIPENPGIFIAPPSTSEMSRARVGDKVNDNSYNKWIMAVLLQPHQYTNNNLAKDPAVVMLSKIRLTVFPHNSTPGLRLCVLTADPMAAMYTHICSTLPKRLQCEIVFVDNMSPVSVIAYAAKHTPHHDVVIVQNVNTFDLKLISRLAKHDSLRVTCLSDAHPTPNELCPLESFNIPHQFLDILRHTQNDTDFWREMRHAMK